MKLSLEFNDKVEYKPATVGYASTKIGSTADYPDPAYTCRYQWHEATKQFWSHWGKTKMVSMYRNNMTISRGYRIYILHNF